ncbi:MAG: acetyl-CoA carboxylase biotin carboxylase subunit [Nitrospirota bacterium]
MFKKILIANRGEIALRIIRACKEMGIKTVAIHSDIDENSLHVRFADESICVGPAESSSSYMNIPAILSAAEITDSEAIHPGYGFLSENANFAEVCTTSGITFIGPTPENIRLAGDKAKAKQTMLKAGIPILPGSDGAVTSENQAIKIARKIRYPVIIKASAGGGGRGLRVVTDEAEFSNAFITAQREAIATFGDGELYIEKYIPEPKHVEVQILADSRGYVIYLGERDCTIQRRHQKLIEESPSPAVDDKLRRKLGEMAVKVARAIRYRNTGTVEFILDRNGDFYFMEMNTRIQVEHPVTEMVTGIDLVKEQLKIASGLPLSYRQSDIRIHGHSIECRINAEDPENFMPSPGTITSYNAPGGPGVRVDTAVYQNYTVSPHYDSMIAKLITHGNNRDEALNRMLRALDEYIIEGIKTTIPFHKKILLYPDFRRGDFSTNFLERFNIKE